MSFWTAVVIIVAIGTVEGDVTVRWGDGKAETWTPDGTGGYTPMQGVFNTLTKNTDNTFTVRRKDMVEFHFNLSNQLARIEDENRNDLTFSYDGSDVSLITDTTGRTIEFSYDSAGRITRI